MVLAFELLMWKTCDGKISATTNMKNPEVRVYLCKWLKTKLPTERLTGHSLRMQFELMVSFGFACDGSI